MTQRKTGFCTKEPTIASWDNVKWAIPRKKPNRGDCGVEDMEFVGYQRNNMWNFQGLTKNEAELPSEFPGQEPWFLASEFLRDLTQFCGISRDKVKQ